jgi:hypothetical protein
VLTLLSVLSNDNNTYVRYRYFVMILTYILNRVGGDN